jgi:hypothetical protein
VSISFAHSWHDCGDCGSNAAASLVTARPQAEYPPAVHRCHLLPWCVVARLMLLLAL